MAQTALRPPEIDDKSVVALTERGERALHEGSTTLSAPELEALVLVDGHSNVAQVLARMPEPARPQLRGALASLMTHGYLSIAADPFGDVIDAGDFFTSAARDTPDASADDHAKADAATEFLRQNGYCVNFARRAPLRKPSAEHPLTVLVIDDDPEIGRLLGRYLKLEGIASRTAGNPEQIVAELRRAPLPDLVLLDIHLPAIDGHTVLDRIRQHPVLKRLPVVVLTGIATREVVLKSLLHGADGHITKPFRIHALVRAVKAALGLPFNPNEEDFDLSL